MPASGRRKGQQQEAWEDWVSSGGGAKAQRTLGRAAHVAHNMRGRGAVWRHASNRSPAGACLTHIIAAVLKRRAAALNPDYSAQRCADGHTVCVVLLDDCPNLLPVWLHNAAAASECLARQGKRAAAAEGQVVIVGAPVLACLSTTCSSALSVCYPPELARL